LTPPGAGGARGWDPAGPNKYAKARFYDPEVGRFISQDTLTGQVDDPPSLHRFFYGRANPTRYVDPTGHQATKTFGELMEDAAVDAIYSSRATEAAKLLESPDRDRKLAEWEKQALSNLPESMRARVREKLAEKQRQEWEHFKEAPDLFYKDPRVVEEGHEGSRWSGPIGEKVGPVLDWLGEKGGKVLDWFSKPLDDFAEKSGKDAGDFVRKQKSPGILEHQVKAVEEAGLEEFFPAGRVGTEFVETTAQVTEKVVEGGTKLAGPGAVRGGLRKAGQAAEELGSAARGVRPRGSHHPRTRQRARTGQEAHRQLERELELEGYETEVVIKKEGLSVRRMQSRVRRR
jgi:RHS repeat-associated protein